MGDLIMFGEIVQEFLAVDSKCKISKSGNGKNFIPRIDLGAECKFNLRYLSIDSLAKVLNKNTLIDQVFTKNETHIYYKKDQEVCALVRNLHYVNENGEIKVSNKPTIKLKSGEIILNSPEFDIPILFRFKRKFWPDNKYYKTLLMSLPEWSYLGTFNKTGVDITFWFEDYHFILTFANSSYKNSTISQAEFEVDGYSDIHNEPNITTLLELFDKLFNLLPKSFVNKSMKLTKSEWLLESQ